MLTFGQILLAILTAILGLVVLPLIAIAVAGTWLVDGYEHAAWQRRLRLRTAAQAGTRPTLISAR